MNRTKTWIIVKNKASLKSTGDRRTLNYEIGSDAEYTNEN